MKLFLLLFLSVSIGSCQTYQYFTIESSHIPRDSENQFVVETDTLLLKYSFNGMNGPVSITVYNKLDVPLLIDWKQSALIIGEEAYSFYSPDSKFTGDLSSTNFRWTQRVSTQTGTITGDIRSMEGIEFIPPKSYKKANSLYLVTGYQKAVDQSAMVRTQVQTVAGNQKMKTATFDSATSPIRFRTYLSMNTGDDLKSSVTLNHSFFVSRVVKGTILPRNFSDSADNGNLFYTNKISGYGKGSASIIGFGLLTALVLVAGDQ